MTQLSGPNIKGNEWKYVKDCLDSGWVSSVGSYVTRFEELIAEFVQAKFAVATSNGTSAIHISLLLSGVRFNDLVIAPNLTFVAPINAITYLGAEPILIDVSESDWQMDTVLLKRFFEEQTFQRDNSCYHKADNRRIQAILPIHILGNMCNMDEIMLLAELHNVIVIEDSTEALGSLYNHKHSGTFGLCGTFSFNGNKIITTGGGGMIVTNNELIAKRAKHLTTQAKSDSFEYIHDEIGYNYRLVNVLAAIGVGQMENLPAFITRKKEIDTFYKSELQGIGDITFQMQLPKVNSNNWLFTIRSGKQKELLNKLNESHLQSRPLWVPMNRLPMFNRLKYYTKTDVTDVLYKECLSIPCSTDITLQELELVIKTIKTCFN